MDTSMENTQAYLSLSNSDVEETSDEEVASNTSDEEAVPRYDGMVLNNPIIRASREFKNDERLGIYQYLLTHSNNGRVKRGSIPRVAGIFKMSVSTVSRIWNRSKENHNSNMPADVSSRKPTRVGRKRVEIDRDRVLAVPLNRRTCIRTLAAEIEMSTTTLHRRIKEGKVKPHTSAVRPALNDDGKIKRLNYCIDMLDTSTFNSKPMFKDMFDYVHIDEKWFNMTKISQRYYLLPDEPKPHRECQNKRFFPKIMFTAAVARPQYDSSGNLIFDGKIGIWAMVKKVPAARNSKNRKAGTLETKPIDPVDKKVSMEFLIDKVLPEIRVKWPTGNTRTIYIQQDNAKPHISKDDEKFKNAASIDGFDIQLKNQPPNSPDMNTLDLGYFNTLQSIQHRQRMNNIDELIVAVEKAYNDMEPRIINKVFLTHQLCMLEVMKARGEIRFVLPHIGKDKLEREGNLPMRIEADSALLHDVLVELNRMPEFWSTLERNMVGSSLESRSENINENLNPEV
ncbi:uncharacterized protein LOC113279201 [Papaver somniferum]|uniref:uncharacterized protein LOC113279201 n=1 Tax=Papaver somniferum TaxID=3469 RepID=UPI000E705B9B|nr:uncharacterized protein LOC113279201 [Papaver somniferum]